MEVRVRAALLTPLCRESSESSKRCRASSESSSCAGTILGTLKSTNIHNIHKIHAPKFQGVLFLRSPKRRRQPPPDAQGWETQKSMKIDKQIIYRHKEHHFQKSKNSEHEFPEGRLHQTERAGSFVWCQNSVKGRL